MKILDLKIFRGPNYWSVYHKQLIELTVDLEDLKDLTSNKFPGFLESIQNLLPSLYNSSAEFRLKMEKGISIQEVILYIARELQLLAGMDCNFYKADYSEGKAYVVFSYTEEKAGVFAGEAAFKIVETLANKKKYTELPDNIDDLIYLKARYSLGATTAYLLDEIKKREIPYRNLNKGSLVLLGYGNKQKKIRTAITDNTSGLGMELAGDKEETKLLLSEAHIPIPKGILVMSEDELLERINEIKFPVVIKPLNANHGRGVTTDINSVDKAVFGFNNAKNFSSMVIVEEFIKGNDYRFLVVNNKLVAATLRSPAMVIGDGHSTINQLIEKENRNPERGEESKHVLALIKLDEATRKILADKKLTPESILPDNQTLFLKETANISMGGTATDVTDIVHQENKFMAERIARIFNMDICGIDLIAERVDIPITNRNGAVIEVNAGPGLRMHSNPQKGKPRNVAKKIVDMLFADTNSAYIPIIAIAEFKDADILARLISHLAKNAGFKPGCNTSEGIYIQEHLTGKGNFIDFEGEQEVLFDPTIDLAVLQCSNKSIFGSGLGFNQCNIAIITAISEVDENSNEQHILKDRIKLLEVLIDTTIKNGYVILNADDYVVYSLLPKIKCNSILFSSDKDSERIKQHCKDGGIAAVLYDNKVIVYKGEWVISATDVKNIPLALNENSDITKYVLPAILSAAILKFNINSIQKGMLSFSTSPLKEEYIRNSYNKNPEKIIL
jgi:cyanophycin synthetase